MFLKVRSMNSMVVSCETLIVPIAALKTRNKAVVQHSYVDEKVEHMR